MPFALALLVCAGAAGVGGAVEDENLELMLFIHELRRELRWVVGACLSALLLRLSKPGRDEGDLEIGVSVVVVVGVFGEGVATPD